MASLAASTTKTAPALRGLVTQEPAFVVSSDMRVVAWNRAIERLTGLPSSAAVGRPCYVVLASISAGSPPTCCRDRCPLMRAALLGWPSGRVALAVETPAGPQRAELSTIAGEADIMHLVNVYPCWWDSGHELAAADGGRPVSLTPRQLEVLQLLSEGVTCRGISERLTISTATARNHIRAVLRELRTHSQLEAVSEARRRGLV